MKIAMFVDQFPATTETFILEQMRGILEEGHDLTIYSNNRNIIFAKHHILQRFNLEEKCQYFYFPENKIKRIWGAIVIFIKVSVEKKRALFRSLNFFKYGKIARSLRLYYLVSQVNDRSYDIIHAQFFPLARLVYCLKDVGALEGKGVVSVRGTDFKLGLGLREKITEKMVFNSFDYFLPVCEFLKKDLIARGCPFQKIEVLHSGIDLSVYSVFSKNAEQKGIHLLSVARLVPYKGIIYAIKAVKQLILKYSSLKYTIVGSGSLRRELGDYVIRNNLQDTVFFKDHLVSAELRELYANSNALIVPSIYYENCREGIPCVVYESLAMGLPVIATAHSGIPEIIIHGSNGLFFEQANENSLAQTIDSFLRDFNLQEKMRQNCRDSVIFYDSSRTNAQLLDIYKRLAHD